MALIVLGVFAASLVLLPLMNQAVWAFIPPVSTHDLALSTKAAGRFALIDGIDTYYERHGAGPPIILIPAGGSHTSTWRYNIDALCRSHEVWTLDLPGSGYTEKPASFPYTHASYARFIHDFMVAMGLSKAVIGGHSLGGAVALEFALDFPNQTAGLILIAAGGYPRDASAGPLILLRYPITNAALMSFSSYPPIVRGFYSYLYQDPESFAADVSSVSEICAINRTPSARAAYYWMQKGLNFDFAIPDPGRITAVTVPTLIVWGREDRVVSVRTAKRFHRDIAGSQLVIVDGAGHMAHEEKPDVVDRAIVSFLSAIRS